MIEFKDISFKFEEKAILTNFSQTIQAGKKVAITGVSGAGKSTILNLLAGFLIPEQGSIFINKTLISTDNISKIRQIISYLPQNFNVPFSSVQELFYSPFNLKINAKLKPTKKQIFESFNQLGLETNLWSKKLDEISGGQKQRILLSSILLLNKKYIFLDEPTSALDKNSTKKLLELLFSLKNTTIIAATHDKLFIDNADFKIEL